MMGLIEMPSMILQLGRVRCILHENGQQLAGAAAPNICVPGMSAEDEQALACLSNELVLKSSEALSPEQLPLEFLGRPEGDWLEDETSMIRALKIQDRSEAIFTVHPDTVLEGVDILMATMTLPAAKVRCTTLPNCAGFYSEDWPEDETEDEVQLEWNGPGRPSRFPQHPGCHDTWMNCKICKERTFWNPLEPILGGQCTCDPLPSSHATLPLFVAARWTSISRPFGNRGRFPRHPSWAGRQPIRKKGHPHFSHDVRAMP